MPKPETEAVLAQGIEVYCAYIGESREPDAESRYHTRMQSLLDRSGWTWREYRVALRARYEARQVIAAR